MEETSQEQPLRRYPFYIKATVIMLGLIIFFFMLNCLQDILVPFGMAVLLAILLNPLSNRLSSFFPRGIGIFLTLLIAVIVISAIFYFLSAEIATFSHSVPALKEKFNLLATQLAEWINTTFGVTIEKQVQMVRQAAEGSQKYVGETIGTLMGFISVVVLIPIYVFFLLFYKPLILDFLFHVFSEKNSLRVAEILKETKSTIQSYIVGLLIEMVIVSAMNSAALLMLGVRSAILIGVIGGILNMIPYLGGIVAIALPILMATVTKDGYSTQLAILASYLVIQFIDNNILVPRIVSSKVQINALVSIIVVLMGGALWGLTGMFLSIPFVAILKIIFDRIDAMKPWGALLGNKIPDVHAGVKWQKRWNKIFAQRAAEK